MQATKTSTLSPTQQAILTHAVDHANGKLVWYPESLKGGALNKVLESLLKRRLITLVGDDRFVVPEGYDAVGKPRPNTSALTTKQKPTDANKPKRSRDNSKQAQVVTLLQRPEGATIAQITTLTGWQSHTVRGAFAGALKHKIGLAITSTKEAGGERVYRAI